MRAPQKHSDSRIRSAGQAPRRASAGALGHWGELFQGRFGTDGPVVLVTLRCPKVWGAARFEPAIGAPLLLDGPLSGRVAERAARLALGNFGRSGLGGRLQLDGSAPPGVGAGSSTLAALTAIRAVAASLGAGLSSAEEAALCLAAEGASDPLMTPEPMRVLWASRQGRALAALPPPPAMTALGVLDGPGAPTDPAENDFADISDLLTLYREGLETRDLDLIGRAATLSAERRQERRALPHWADLQALAAETGAAGIARAHTGSAVALLFTPDAPTIANAAAALAEIGLSGVGRFDPAGPGVSRAAARG